VLHVPLGKAVAAPITYGLSLGAVAWSGASAASKLQGITIDPSTAVGIGTVVQLSVLLIAARYLFEAGRIFTKWKDAAESALELSAQVEENRKTGLLLGQRLEEFRGETARTIASLQKELEESKRLTAELQSRLNSDPNKGSGGVA